MRRGARGAIMTVAAGAGLVLLAAAVQLSAPDEDAQQAAFAQHVPVGQSATGRNVSATVHGVRLTHTVHALGWDGTTSGTWVVVDATISTELTEELPDAVLRIGGVSYSASDRPAISALNGIVVDPALPYSGAFLFEVPRAAVESSAARHATIRLYVQRDPVLDSSIEVTFDLTRIRPTPSLDLASPRRVTP